MTVELKDDNFVIRWNKCMTALIKDLEKDLEIMTKWLRDSGLKVNEEKTELCLFHRLDHHPITITLNNKIILSRKKMNVLGVTFDSKMQWGDHISLTIKKANTALHAIRLIKHYFTPTELRTLITSNFIVKTLPLAPNVTYLPIIINFTYFFVNLAQ